MEDEFKYTEFVIIIVGISFYKLQEIFIKPNYFVDSTITMSVNGTVVFWTKKQC